MTQFRLNLDFSCFCKDYPLGKFNLEIVSTELKVKLPPSKHQDDRGTFYSVHPAILFLDIYIYLLY